MISRRRVLQSIALAATAFSAPAWALDDHVTVITSYPQEVVARFEEAFERLHPGTKMEVLWHMPEDALPYLLDPTHHDVDAYWSPAPRNFAILRDRGLLQPITLDRTSLPMAIGKQPISDPTGLFLAFEVAGFGLTVNPDYLKSHRLPEPRNWADLADPIYAGHVNFPIPSEAHFAHSLLEIILQAHGWTDGWALLSAIAGNSQLVSAGAFVSDEVGRGERGIGASIDFFAASAKANGAPIKFVYPPENGYSPAHVAVIKTAPHPEAAQAFAAFVLSEEGQEILFHPDIRKLPVRPAAYTHAPADYFNPFTAAGKTSFAYDPGLVQARRKLDEALFDQMGPNRLEAFKAMWAAIHAAQVSAGGKEPDALRRARALAVACPVTPKQAADPAYLKTFDERVGNPSAKQAAAAEEARWSSTFDRNYAEATALARSVTGQP